jgi:hypothetical protein
MYVHVRRFTYRYVFRWAECEFPAALPVPDELSGTQVSSQLAYPADKKTLGTLAVKLLSDVVLIKGAMDLSRAGISWF